MIVGILIKIKDSNRQIRKNFKVASDMVKYWKAMRRKYRGSYFFIYRGTHSVHKYYYHTKDNIRYCPYCEEMRDFKPVTHDIKCPVCNISIDSCNVKMCNYPEE